jgi:MFS family permease
MAAMSIPYYPMLWGVGLLLNLTRWMTLFLCSYLVNQLSNSTLLVQLVGVSLFAPMFLGGMLAGVISDRLDRRRTLMVITTLLIPASLAMAAANLAGLVEVWMVYPFALAVGTGLLADMTIRRALVYDLVGGRYLTNALALEALAMTSGTLFGSLGAGTVISLFGIGETFLVIAAVYAVALLLLVRVRLAQRRPLSGGSLSFLADLIAGLRYLRRQRALVSVLGVTVIMNLFYFSFIPMVPVFGDKLGVGAFWTSLLLAGNAVGSIGGAALIARGLPWRRGLIYAGGSTLSLVFLFVFAASGWYPLALLALAVAGIGIAGFATMQSVLVMISADDEMRGRAMGLLSMSIGALPFSMLVLGAVAQAVGPATGVMLSVLVGLVALSLWSLRLPESLRLD